MMTLKALVKRNTSLFFKDKGMFFTALITPLILLVLYATFLSNVYEDTFRGIIEGMGFSVSDKIVGGCVG
jgi:multidrug/hemolysin transport system permease protein